MRLTEARGGGQGFRKSGTLDQDEEEAEATLGDGLDADGGYSINTEFESYDPSEEVLLAARRAVDAGLFCSAVGLFVGLLQCDERYDASCMRRASMPPGAC